MPQLLQEVSPESVSTWHDLLKAVKDFPFWYRWFVGDIFVFSLDPVDSKLPTENGHMPTLGHFEVFGMAWANPKIQNHLTLIPTVIFSVEFLGLQAPASSSAEHRTHRSWSLYHEVQLWCFDMITFHHYSHHMSCSIIRSWKTSSTFSCNLQSSQTWSFSILLCQAICCGSINSCSTNIEVTKADAALRKRCMNKNLNGWFQTKLLDFSWSFLLPLQEGNDVWCSFHASCLHQ